MTVDVPALEKETQATIEIKDVAKEIDAEHRLNPQVLTEKFETGVASLFLAPDKESQKATRSELIDLFYGGFQYFHNLSAKDTHYYDKERYFLEGMSYINQNDLEHQERNEMSFRKAIGIMLDHALVQTKKAVDVESPFLQRGKWKTPRWIKVNFGGLTRVFKGYDEVLEMSAGGFGNRLKRIVQTAEALI